MSRETWRRAFLALHLLGMSAWLASALALAVGAVVLVGESDPAALRGGYGVVAAVLQAFVPAVPATFLGGAGLLWLAGVRQTIRQPWLLAKLALVLLAVPAAMAGVQPRLSAMRAELASGRAPSANERAGLARVAMVLPMALALAGTLGATQPFRRRIRRSESETGHS